MTVLETENLTHYYENGMAGAVAAIENINVKFEKGEIVGIIGHTAATVICIFLFSLPAPSRRWSTSSAELSTRLMSIVCPR